jgi:hypothetical protein
MNRLRPKTLYISWLIGFPIVSAIFSILNGIGHSGGEQVELTTFAYCLNVYVFGSLILIIATTIFYRSWFRQYYIFISALFLFFTYLAIMGFINH